MKLTRRELGLAGLAALAAVEAPARAAEPPKPKLVTAWGRKGDAEGEFFSPIGIAIDGRDRVFVTDLNNSRLQYFSHDGGYLGGFDLPRDTPNRRSCIIGGIALSERNGSVEIYLAYMVQHFIGVYDETGKLLRRWGKQGNGDGDVWGPGGMAFAPDGTLYVADQNNHRIQMFTPEGRFLGKWGKHGSEPGQFGGLERAGSRFGGPHFVALDASGRVYTTEGVHGRVQVFSPFGQPLMAWGNKTNEPGGFGSYSFGNLSNTFGPIAVAVDKQQRVWVGSLNDRVQCFTPEGRYLGGITTSGTEPGQLHRPHGMAFDSRGDLYICDATNERIQRFSI